jgi:hypothetical protein
VELYLHFPNTPSWRGDQLKHRDNFTFTFTIHLKSALDPTLNITQLRGKTSTYSALFRKINNNDDNIDYDIPILLKV